MEFNPKLNGVNVGAIISVVLGGAFRTAIASYAGRLGI